MVQGCVGNHRVEPAELAGIEDVRVPPDHRSSREALLGSLQNRTVDIHSDDMRHPL